MPQLDKYIFFNHVISLTIFFALIYVFIRKSVVPELSTLIKYRKKRLTLFNQELASYEKLLQLSKNVFEKKGKTYTSNLSLQLEKLTTFYTKNSSFRLLNLYNNNFSIIKNNNQIAELIIRNKKEAKRLNSLI